MMITKGERTDEIGAIVITFMNILSINESRLEMAKSKQQ